LLALLAQINVLLAETDAVLPEIDAVLAEIDAVLAQRTCPACTKRCRACTTYIPCLLNVQALLAQKDAVLAGIDAVLAQRTCPACTKRCRACTTYIPCLLNVHALLAQRDVVLALKQVSKQQPLRSNRHVSMFWSVNNNRHTPFVHIFYQETHSLCFRLLSRDGYLFFLMTNKERTKIELIFICNTYKFFILELLFFMDILDISVVFTAVRIYLFL